MVETKVILCDLCKKQVATLKCAFCGKDLCSGNCSAVYNIYFGAGGSAYIIFYFCNNSCFNLVIEFIKKTDAEGKNNKLYQDVEKLFLNFVKKGVVLDKLEENGEKREA